MVLARPCLAVTLLAYMPEANRPPPNCLPLDELMSQLAQRFPSALLLPSSQRPPRTTRPWAQQDWVTVPAGMPADGRVRLLVTAAKWFEVAVAVFLGADAESDFLAFNASSCIKLLWTGSSWLSSDRTNLGGEFDATLSDVLESRLPMLCSAAAVATQNISDEYRSSRKVNCPIRVFTQRPLNAEEVSALHNLSQRYPSCVELRVPLRKGLSSLQGMTHLRTLLKRDPAMKCTVIAENTWFSAAAEILTSAIAKSRSI